MTVKMKKPEKLKTAHWIFGVNVLGKDEVEVPEHLVAEFKKLGFEEIKKRGRKPKLLEGEDG